MRNLRERHKGLTLNRSLWLYSLGKSGTAAKSEGDGNALRCPKCAVTMRAVPLPRLVVDVCPTCRGIFLDDGELEKLGA